MAYLIVFLRNSAILLNSLRLSMNWIVAMTLVFVHYFEAHTIKPTHCKIETNYHVYTRAQAFPVAMLLKLQTNTIYCVA